ncbi:MAG: hypothetical protein WAV55_00670 [Clostridiaceae bacterium]
MLNKMDGLNEMDGMDGMNEMDVNELGQKEKWSGNGREVTGK